MGTMEYSLLWVVQDLYHQPKFSKLGFFCFIRVPYYIGDLKRGPYLENHPSGGGPGEFSGLGSRVVSGGSFGKLEVYGPKTPVLRDYSSCLPTEVLGGSWVVISGGCKSPNMGYNSSYPTYNPTSYYP